MTSDKQEKIDEQLRPLYAELQKYGQTQDWDRALKTTRKILGISSNEKKATQSKIICLMQLDKFDEAYGTMTKNANDTADLFFERAYCEYRLNRIEDAYNTLKSIERGLSEREQELLAQVLFKLEKYNECVDYYRSLVKNNADEYQSTRQANFIAALATWKLTDPSCNVQLESNDLSDETYDTTYNSACVLLSSGKYAEAEIKLRNAEAQCRRELEEEGDMNEEEISRETANIRVQLAYCLQQEDKNVDALTLYNDVLKTKPTDLAVIAVASNNLAVLNRDQNLFDSRKRIKTATAPETEPKLNAFQKKILQVNEALLAIYTGQHETARRILDKMVQKNNDTDDSVPLAKVSLLMKEKKLPEATQLLQEFIENGKQRSISLYCRLTYVQLLLSQGKVNQACDYLRSDEELLVKPGIVATLVTLYNYLEDTKSAAQVLNEAVDRLYNLDRTKGKHSRALAYLIKQNIIYQEKQGNGKRVTEMLEILHKLYPNDTNTLSKLIIHYLKSDPERANLLSQKLPSIKQLAEGIDVDTLESTFGKRVTKAEKTIEKTKASDSGSTATKTVTTTSAEKKKKKRKRKIRLPKKYDPTSKPDPERWLPLRERTYYRGKRGKRGKQAAVGKGTQGAVGSDQSATTTITTSTGAQRSMPSSKGTGASGSSATQPKPMPPSGKSAASKRKGRR
ncbi:unnamed protein product [Rotaria socialis]|uniref:Signal recognition particle subunit SRP72 n=1 Tax=Rotaria socialis TaxID=392032 RepID=A0A820UMX8_9BILA|nr:unnamed protein product [Rotaria socialis]CAF4487538.1 unnamed protein product [Rotaria socialis]